MEKLLEREWLFLREGVEDLEQYLLSPELYWPLPGTNRIQGQEGLFRLSLGNLELSQARLAAVRWPEKEQKELDGLIERVNSVHSRWRVNWSRKAAQEFPARIKQWQSYLQEIHLEHGQRNSGYAFEVRARAILAFLKEDLTGPSANAQQALASLDTLLRGLTEPGPFVWEPEIEPGFPKETFWYLYVQLRAG